MEPTHIIVEFKSQDYETLFRASDGMRLGHRKGPLVIYGENPHKAEGRMFLDSNCARRFITEKLPADDAKASGGTDFAVELRQGEGAVILPPDSMALPGFSPNKFQ